MSDHIMGDSLLIENFIGRWLRGRKARSMENKAQKLAAKSQYYSNAANLQRQYNDHEKAGWKAYRNSD